MPFEYKMLIVMTAFYLLAWIPSSIGKYQSFGWKWLASNRKPITDKPMVPWGARAEQAYTNLKDYFPGFIVAILVLGILTKFDHTTAWAAGLYVVGRIIHLFAYIAGSVNIRFLAFLLAMSANFFLLIKAL